jgi:DNA-binding LacI/PurR family transcriptional regulator
VTGFDGGLQGWLVDETLTTVRIPATRVAEMLVARLMGLLDGGPPPESGLVLPTELVIGSSG